jgi:outer membrane murein-binding lipoprotein Lpp
MLQGMNRFLLAALALWAPVCAMAADDPKVAQLEQDVRDLQRQVLAQSQQLNELRMRLSQQPASQVRLPSSPAATTNTDLWLDASRWQRLRVGMSELEVISLLGPPTSMRTTDGQRVLLYAMEIGASGFLSGRVNMRDRVVLEVQSPVLR